MACLGLLPWASAQSDSQDDPWADRRNVMIFGSPQHLVNNGLRLDIEFPLNADRTRWLVVAPQYYSLFRQVDNTFFFRELPGESLAGFGLEVFQKHFSRGKAPEGAYFAYGLYSQRIVSQFNAWSWESELLDGREIFVYRNSDETQTNTRLGATAFVGFQLEILEHLFVDLYTGVGVRYAFVDVTNDVEPFVYNQNNWDYGYSGTSLIGGFRLGVYF